ncbi:hypothetical protein [Geodermatophilus sp. SYSU D01119]
MRTTASPVARRPTWPSGDPVTVRHGSVTVRPEPHRAPETGTAGLLLPAVVLGLGVPRMLLTGDYAGLHGTAAWALLTAVAGVAAALALLTPVVPGLSRRAAEVARMRHALRTHTDPGPELRTRLDRYARRVLRLHWMGRAMPVLPAVLLLQGDWDRPATSLPAAVVLVAGYTALALWHRRQTLAAAWWVADRPGPARPAPPVPWWEPWLGGRRLLALSCGYVLLVVVLTLLGGR